MSYLEILRAYFENESLDLISDPSWGGGSEESRLEIRKAIEARTGVDCSDLSKLPEVSKQNVSISHTQGLGGFALVDKPAVVGFDIEPAGRVNEKVMARMAAREELLGAPSPTHLWVAKESLFKSLRGETQPKVISSLQVLEWQTYRHEKLEKKNGSFFSFRARLDKGSDLRGKGLVFQEGAFILSLFL